MESLTDLRARVAGAARALHGPDHPQAAPEQLLAATLVARAARPAGDGERLATLVRDLLRLGPSPGASRKDTNALLDNAVGALYAADRADGRGLVRASLFRGLVQLERGQVALGAQHVQGALARGGRELSPTERALGEWGLVGAALQREGVTTASAIARRWLDGANRDGLEAEGRRARLVLLLLGLLRGDRALDRGLLDEVDPALPGWSPTLDRLRTWADPPGSAKPRSGEALPLLLGLDPWSPVDLADVIAKRGSSLAALCALRVAYPDAKAAARLDTDALQWLIELCARWDLARPMREYERALGTLAPERHLRTVLGRHLGTQAAAVALGDAGDEATERRALVLMADVEGYSELCDGAEPRAAHRLLSPLFKVLHEELEPAGGVILEFVGDSVMVVFDAFHDGPDTPPLVAVGAAARCARRLALEAALLTSADGPGLALGLGLHAGPVARGYLGGLRRCHLAILGRTVNVAARLESLTRQLPTPIAVSEEVFGGPPEPWLRPLDVHFALRDLGPRKLKGIHEPVRTYGVDALVRSWIDFAPMGFVAAPEPGVVYLDTGCSWQAGIVDTHGADEGAGSAGSTCARVLARPELVVEHIRGAASVEFRLHGGPDLDSCASLTACYELLGGAPRLGPLRALAAYVSAIDEGQVPAPEHIEDSLYGLFVAHVHLAGQACRSRGGAFDDHAQLEAGLRVVDAALFLLELPGAADPSRVFAARPAWFADERALLRRDRATYLATDRPRGHPYRARVGGAPDPVDGLWLDHPTSLLFKHWARTDPDAPGGRGWAFMTVDWSTPEKGRFMISVAPDSGLHLEGLGQALEALESERRQALGKPRPVEPRRLPADNSDPWYGGQGHGYTIIDAPSSGSVLTPTDVQRVHEGCGG